VRPHHRWPAACLITYPHAHSRAWAAAVGGVHSYACTWSVQGVRFPAPGPKARPSHALRPAATAARMAARRCCRLRAAAARCLQATVPASLVLPLDTHLLLQTRSASFLRTTTTTWSRPGAATSHACGAPWRHATSTNQGASPRCHSCPVFFFNLFHAASAAISGSRRLSERARQRNAPAGRVCVVKYGSWCTNSLSYSFQGTLHYRSLRIANSLTVVGSAPQPHCSHGPQDCKSATARHQGVHP
jgi:hypothetical protein